MEDLNRSMDLGLGANAFAHLICEEFPDATFTANAAKRLEDVFDTVAVPSSEGGAEGSSVPEDGLKVIVRVRPLTAQEGNETTTQVVSRHCLRTVAPASSLSARLSKQGRVIKDFAFSRVLGEESTQAEVFEASVEPMMSGFLNGGSCLLFAYGMTGAGKTYTIVGDQAHPGVVPALLKRAFKSRQREATYSMSCLEIYQESIYDLLTESDRRTALKVVHINGVAEAKDLSSHTITSVDHGTAMVAKALKRRTVGSHALNKDSSRSHCLCTIRIHKKNGAVGVFNIVDLAGSERAERTGAAATGRQREANVINTSLMILWRCLQHVRKQSIDVKDATNTSILPFRESKLTHLLMHQIARSDPQSTVMIVNISPSVGDFDETQHILNNAALATQIRGVCERSLKGLGREAEVQVKTGNDKRKRKHERTTSTTSTAIVAAATRDNEREETRPAKSARTAVAEVAEAGREEMQRVAAENKLLRAQIDTLTERIAETEVRIREDVVKEMEQRTEDLVTENERLIEELRCLKAEDRLRGGLTTSARKWQKNRLDGYLSELQDRVAESEAEMKRMEEEHAEEVRRLNDELSKYQQETIDAPSIPSMPSPVQVDQIVQEVITDTESNELSDAATSRPKPLSPRHNGSPAKHKRKKITKATEFGQENLVNVREASTDLGRESTQNDPAIVKESKPAKGTPMAKRLRGRSKTNVLI